MYSFKEIQSDEINNFNDEVKKGHIFQSSYWAHVKGGWGVKYIGGFDEKNNLVFTCTLLLRKIPYTGKYMAYSPRGFVCDFSNFNLIKEFTDFMKSYGKKNNIAFLKIDPDIHLNEDEESVELGKKVKDALISFGYKNSEAKNFENIQPNFVFRLDLDPTNDKEAEKKRIFDNFTSKTRYNIKVSQDRGLTCEVYDKENITDEILDRFHELMVITGKRDNFIVRQRQYFKDMVEKIYPYCRVYMIKYNYQNDFDRINEKLQTQVKNLERHTKKKETQEKNLQTETDQEKIERIQKKIADAETNIKEAERQIEGFKERLSEIEEFKEQGEVYVSGAIYLYFSGKGWYLYGASHNILRDTMPNFLMQWSMIQDTIDLGCYMYDFRGVSGDLNPENPLYGLYKFKKGYNGKFVEFIGEFDLVIDELVYGTFNKVLPAFKKIRSLIKKR